MRRYSQEKYYSVQQLRLTLGLKKILIVYIRSFGTHWDDELKNSAKLKSSLKVEM